MRHFLFLSVFLFTIIFFQADLFCQSKKGIISIDDKITAEITPDESHIYFLDLKENQFSILRLLQRGVDLSVTTYDPSGDKIDYFDSPNGANGVEIFTIRSEVKGKYKIAINPLNEIRRTGNYDLEVQKIRAKATNIEEMVDELFAEWDTDSSPGAAVAVVKGNRIVHKNAYGMANLEYDIPNSPSTIFHIASISKQFTVFSILLLEADGKLSLEDDIRKFIPEVPDFGHTITLRHLASHTSGMRDQWNLLAMAGWRLDDIITKEHVLNLVTHQKDLNFDPGEEFMYCNTGFTLLAEVVARVSESSFAEFTQERIFKPLGMTNTLFYDDHEKIVKNRAYSYDSGDQGFKKSVLSYANVGATSLFTTVEDLSLWTINFQQAKIGNNQIFTKMNTKSKLNNGTEINGALGQFVGEYKGIKEIQHGGADAGYRTYLARYPEEDLAVVVFSNDASFNPGLLAHKTVDIYLEDIIVQAETEEKESIVGPKVEENVTVSGAIMDSYTGRYELQPGFIIIITLEEGKLFGQATGQGKLELESISTTEWKVKGVDAKLIFNVEGEEKPSSLTLHQSGQQMEAPRVKEFDPDNIDLSEFVGTFYSEELSTKYDIKIKEGKLIATHFRTGDIDLTPIKKDFFSGSTWYFGQIEFVRNDDDEIEACLVSSGRVRNLKLVKH